MAGELVRTRKEKTGAREGSSPRCEAVGAREGDGEAASTEIEVAAARCPDCGSAWRRGRAPRNRGRLE
jgi:hypothetical protein